MSDNLTYKGFTGTIKYSEEDKCLIGKVLHIRSTLIYSGDSVAEMQEMFESSIDDYLALCEEKGISPEKPCSGSFNVRISPKLHYEAVREATKLGYTLNNFVEKAIASKVNHHHIPQNIKIEVQHRVITNDVEYKTSFPFLKENTRSSSTIRTMSVSKDKRTEVIH